MSFGSFVLLPNITGSINDLSNIADSAYDSWNSHNTGAFAENIKSSRTSVDISSGTSSDTAFTLKFKASLSNSIYGLSDSVQPSALVLNYVIKY